MRFSGDCLGFCRQNVGRDFEFFLWCGLRLQVFGSSSIDHHCNSVGVLAIMDIYHPAKAATSEPTRAAIRPSPGGAYDFFPLGSRRTCQSWQVGLMLYYTHQLARLTIWQQMFPWRCTLCNLHPRYKVHRAQKTRGCQSRVE